MKKYFQKPRQMCYQVTFIGKPTTQTITKEFCREIIQTLKKETKT